MSDKEKTTLMMVTYNRLELTKKTIQGLTESNERPCDLVIVDNGSSDGTQDYLISLQEECPEPFENIHLIMLNENKGIAIGRNIALKKADDLKTKWYCTIDNDVALPDNWLDSCIDILSANKSFGALGVNFENTSFPLVTKGGFTFQEKPQGNLGTACMVFKKQLHQMIGFFNTEYGQYGEEDADFGMRARVAGFRMGYVKHNGDHLGSDENDTGEYREFKTKQHADNLALFKKNCALYAHRQKSLLIPYKD